MSKLNIGLIGKKSYKYNDKLILLIPTINQIRDDEMSENSFWQEVNLFSQTPSDNIAQLALAGIDFTELSEYMYFLLVFQQLKLINKQNNNKSQLFINMNLWDLELKEDNSNGSITLNDTNGIVINETIYGELSELVCYFACREKTKAKKFGNEFAKKKRIEVEIKKLEKLQQQQDKDDSNLFDKLILRLVCNANFPYNFTTIGEVTLFEFMYSLKQIDKDISVNDVMQSRFYGADVNKLPQEVFNRYVI